MFKKSHPRQPPGELGSISSHLKSRKQRLLTDPHAWHNVFFEEITSRIDELPYAVVYGKTGHPNAPVRILLSMLILKEGQDWTDEQLYNECRFNLQVMWALGLTSLDKDVPTESTYYDFKSRLVHHYEQTGEDLLGHTLAQLTQQQVSRYKVSGRELRMDSKLFNSNIARCTRLQLVIGVLQKFYKAHQQDQATLAKLEAADRDRLKELAARAASNHTYSLSNQEKAQMLEDLGGLLARIHSRLNDEDTQDPASGTELVERLLAEQYEVQPGDPSSGASQQVRPKNKNALDANTLQSPHDSQACYRKKESGQQTQIVRGYCANITETCAQAPDKQTACLNLITHVQTEAASVSDDVFFRAAIEQSEAVTGQNAEAAWTDGAYNSQPNADFVDQRSEQPLAWYLDHLQGLASNFEFAFNELGQLLVTDLRTNQTQIAILSPKKKWRILDAPHTKNKYRYLEPALIRNYFRRKAIQQQPPQIRNRRANVEATIHQIFHTLNGNKSKYRGKAPNHCFVLCRCIWVNFRRIWAFSLPNSLRTAQNWLENLLTVLGGFLNGPQVQIQRCLAVDFNSKFYSVVSMNLLKN